MHVCTDPVNENSLHEIKFDDNESLLTTAKYRHYIELYVSFGHNEYTDTRSSLHFVNRILSVKCTVH